MTRAEAVEFAQRWLANWNGKDLEGILSHFGEDATFTSPRAAERIYGAKVTSKRGLRHYWGTGIAVIQTRCLKV